MPAGVRDLFHFTSEQSEDISQFAKQIISHRHKPIFHSFPRGFNTIHHFVENIFFVVQSQDNGHHILWCPLSSFGKNIEPEARGECRATTPTAAGGGCRKGLSAPRSKVAGAPSSLQLSGTASGVYSTSIPSAPAMKKPLLRKWFFQRNKSLTGFVKCASRVKYAFGV